MVAILFKTIKVCYLLFLNKNFGVYKRYNKNPFTIPTPINKTIITYLHPQKPRGININAIVDSPKAKNICTKTPYLCLDL